MSESRLTKLCHLSLWFVTGTIPRKMSARRENCDREEHGELQLRETVTDRMIKNLVRSLKFFSFKKVFQSRPEPILFGFVTSLMTNQ